jgi:hypothetical protein
MSLSLAFLNKLAEEVGESKVDEYLEAFKGVELDVDPPKSPTDEGTSSEYPSEEIEEEEVSKEAALKVLRRYLTKSAEEDDAHECPCCGEWCMGEGMCETCKAGECEKCSEGSVKEAAVKLIKNYLLKQSAGEVPPQGAEAMPPQAEAQVVPPEAAAQQGPSEHEMVIQQLMEHVQAHKMIEELGLDAMPEQGEEPEEESEEPEEKPKKGKVEKEASLRRAIAKLL